MTTMRAVRFHELGSADVLQIENVPLEEPGEGHFRLKVEAIGLNRAEIMFREGNYLEQPVFPSGLGLEAAGTVDAVGPGVSSVKVGDRVSVGVGLSMRQYSLYGEYAVVPAYAALRNPDNIDFVTAAAAWVQYLTTYFAFVDVGHLQAGQHVLITAASSSTGQAAIEMARLFGATSIAATRTRAKQQALLGAGADHVIVTDEENLPERVMQITGGKGAELIYDPVAGKSLETIAQAAARGGQIILYGLLDSGPTTYPLYTAFARNFLLRTYMIYTFTGAETMHLPRKEEAFTRGAQWVYDRLQSGELKPVIARTFALDDIREAHRYMESNQQLGKIVVTVK